MHWSNVIFKSIRLPVVLRIKLVTFLIFSPASRLIENVDFPTYKLKNLLPAIIFGDYVPHS